MSELDPTPLTIDADHTLRQTAEDHFYRAVDCIADGDLTTAIAAFRDSLGCDPTYDDAWHGLIRVLQDAGHLDEAVAEATRLAEKYPDDVLVHTRLSILYQMRGQVPEAEAESAKARVLGWKQELKNKAPSSQKADGMKL